jgi:RNA-binding protein 8A
MENNITGRQSKAKVMEEINYEQRKGRGFHVNKKMSNLDFPINIDSDGGTQKNIYNGNYMKSVEGWILFVSGINEEATEDILLDKFGEFGRINKLNLAFDRLTGYAKGYALIEYEDFDDAKRAIDAMEGKTLFGKVVHLDFAFLRHPFTREIVH